VPLQHKRWCSQLNIKSTQPRAPKLWPVNVFERSYKSPKLSKKQYHELRSSKFRNPALSNEHLLIKSSIVEVDKVMVRESVISALVS